MSTPLNLNRARKDRARMKKRAQADENAVKFGRTKAEKKSDTDTEATRIRKLDAHRRTP